MEAKLAEYRNRKQKEDRQSKTVGQRLFAIFERTGEQTTDSKQENSVTSPTSLPSKPRVQRDVDDKDDKDSANDNSEDNTDLVSPSGKFHWLLLALKAVLWCIVWLIFIELQFGAVFFALSALLFVYFNTGTRPASRAKTLSAYSVFNPECERLQGTITAEQFEAELLHRKPVTST